MNVQELIKRIRELAVDCSGPRPMIDKLITLDLVKQLDETEKSHADEAPRYVKNILARLRELPLHDREVWLKAIMGEFEQDFSHAKWREGYEQGKFEGMIEREKVEVPQFVADWYEKHKDDLEYDIWEYILNWRKQEESEFHEWMNHANNKPLQTIVNMHQFGYEVEKEKRYLVKVKGICGNHETLNNEKHSKKWLFSDREENSLCKTTHTRKELEDANFGWVFDCPGIEIEEVE